jgi:hypothetical protein
MISYDVSRAKNNVPENRYPLISCFIYHFPYKKELFWWYMYQILRHTKVTAKTFLFYPYEIAIFDGKIRMMIKLMWSMMSIWNTHSQNIHWVVLQ